MYFNRFNLQIASIASKDRSRPTMTGVAFWPDRTVATDGYRLVEISTPDQQWLRQEHVLKAVNGETGYPLVVPADACKEFARKLPRKCTFPALECGAIEGVQNGEEGCAIKATLAATTDAQQVFREEVRLIAGKYPDIDGVKPKLQEARAIIALNPELLVSTIQAMNVCDEREPWVILSVYKDCITLETASRGGQKAYAIQMGRRFPESAEEHQQRVDEIEALHALGSQAGEEDNNSELDGVGATPEQESEGESDAAVVR